MDLDHIPLLAPPPSQTSNFVNPHSLAPMIIVVSGVSLALMIPMVTVRFYVKARITRSFWWDDWSCGLATLGICGIVKQVGRPPLRTDAAKHLTALKSAGIHMWDVPVSAYTPALARREAIGLWMALPPTTFFTKLSLLLLYLRVFRPNLTVRYLIYIGILMNFLFYLATFIFIAAACLPRSEESWFQALSSRGCTRTANISYFQGAFSLLSDLFIFILPIPVVSALNLPLRKKIGVTAIFMTGLLACLSSVIGLWLKIMYARSEDRTYNLGKNIIVTIAETNIGIICACAPSLAAFFRHYPVNFSSFFTLSCISARCSKGNGYYNKSHQEIEPKLGEVRLETHILVTTIQGEGIFVQTSDCPLQDLKSPHEHEFTGAQAS